MLVRGSPFEKVSRDLNKMRKEAMKRSEKQNFQREKIVETQNMGLE